MESEQGGVTAVEMMELCELERVSPYQWLARMDPTVRTRDPVEQVAVSNTVRRAALYYRNQQQQDLQMGSELQQLLAARRG
jgi:hypothetical protein